MAYRTKYASFGSVSTGTLRDEDLIPAFVSELEYQLGRQVTRFRRGDFRKLIHEANWIDFDDGEGAPDWIVDELIDALDAFAPPGGYFGSLPGDGADFGYWLHSDFIREFDGLKVSDLSEVPADYRGEVLLVNDHGNCTLFVAAARGRLTEIWGIV